MILTFDGEDVNDTRELVRIVGDSAVGETVRVIVFRDGETQTLRVTLGRRETAEGLQPDTSNETSENAPTPDQNDDILGMRLTPLTDALREELGVQMVSGGLVIEAIDPESDAAAKGLQPSDVIVEVAQQSVTGVDMFHDRIETAVEAGQKSILLLIRRSGSPRFVALSLED